MRLFPADTGIHLKVMVIVTTIFVVTLLPTGYLPLLSEREYLLKQARNRAGALMRSLEVLTRFALVRGDVEPIRQFIDNTYYEEKNVRLIQVFDTADHLRAQVGPRQGGAGALDFYTTQKVYTDRQYVGRIVLHYDLAEARGLLDRVTLLILLFVVDAVLVLGFFLHLSLRRTVTAPLTHLMRVTREIGRGELETRAKVGSGDELGQLARSINEMALGLSQSRAALDAVNRSLEERIAERTQQLAKEKAVSESIIASLTHGLITFDSDRVLTGMNAAAARMMGVDVASAIGKHCYEVVRCEVCQTRCLHQRAVSEGRSVTEEDLLLDGAPGEIPITLGSALLRGADGQVIGGVETFQDISGMKALYEKLRRSDRLSSVGTLAAGLAHEINNPIGNISTFTQLLLEKRSPSPEMLERSLTNIQNETERAAGIVRGLLDFSHQAPARKDSLDLVSVVDDSLRMTMPAFSTRAHHDVRTQYPERHPCVRGDALRLKQVFINLMTNAFQAMPSGGTLALTIHNGDAQAAGEGACMARVEVADTGSGIRPDDLQRVFDPFFTTKDVGLGTGLGLSISHTIVQEHGGVIEVRSQPGQGSVFTVVLPTIEREPDA